MYDDQYRAIGIDEFFREIYVVGTFGASIRIPYAPIIRPLIRSIHPHPVCPRHDPVPRRYKCNTSECIAVQHVQHNTMQRTTMQHGATHHGAAHDDATARVQPTAAVRYNADTDQQLNIGSTPNKKACAVKYC